MSKVNEYCENCKFWKCIEITAFLVRTAQQSNIVYDSLWKITAGTELVQRGRTVAL